MLDTPDDIHITDKMGSISLTTPPEGPQRDLFNEIVMKRRLERIKHLIEVENAQPWYCNGQLVYFAIEKCHHSIAKYLIDSIKDILPSYGLRLMLHAIEFMRTEIVEYLMEKHNVNPLGNNFVVLDSVVAKQYLGTFQYIFKDVDMWIDRAKGENVQLRDIITHVLVKCVMYHSIDIFMYVLDHPNRIFYLNTCIGKLVMAINEAKDIYMLSCLLNCVMQSDLDLTKDYIYAIVNTFKGDMLVTFLSIIPKTYEYIDCVLGAAVKSLHNEALETILGTDIVDSLNIMILQDYVVRYGDILILNTYLQFLERYVSSKYENAYQESILNGNNDAIEALMAKVNSQRTYYHERLCLNLAKGKRKGVLSYVFEKTQVNPHMEKDSLIKEVLQYDDVDAFLWLLRHSRHAFAVNKNLLVWAIERGSLEAVKCLLEETPHFIHSKFLSGIDVMFPICLNKENRDMIVYLGVQRGIRLPMKDSSLLKAVEERDIVVVKYMIEILGKDIHHSGDKALLTAIEKGHFDVVKYLLEECGGNCYACGEDILRVALRNGHLELARYLIEAQGIVSSREDYLHPHRPYPSYIKEYLGRLWCGR